MQKYSSGKNTNKLFLRQQIKCIINAMLIFCYYEMNLKKSKETEYDNKMHQYLSKSQVFNFHN